MSRVKEGSRMTRYKRDSDSLPIKVRALTCQEAIHRVEFVFNEMQCTNAHRLKLVTEILTGVYDKYKTYIPESVHQRALISKASIVEKYKKLLSEVAPLRFLKKRLNERLQIK